MTHRYTLFGPQVFFLSFLFSSLMVLLFSLFTGFISHRHDHPMNTPTPPPANSNTLSCCCKQLLMGCIAQHNGEEMRGQEGEENNGEGEDDKDENNR